MVIKMMIRTLIYSALIAVTVSTSSPVIFAASLDAGVNTTAVVQIKNAKKTLKYKI